MKPAHIIKAWGRILQGYKPNLSIEITRECPLRCPGCYAYGDEHLGGDVVLRELADFKGQALIDGVLDLVRRQRPAALSIVGGEPLVRFRELDVLLPRLTAMGIHTQVVTSAVRPIPRMGGHAAAPGRACRWTAFNPSTMCVARRPHTSAFSSTSRDST